MQGMKRYMAAGAVCALAAGCGGSQNNTTTPPTPPVTPTVTINATPSITFSPATVTVDPGSTVFFAFGGVAHNVFFDNDPAGAPANIDGANANVTVKRTFSTAGTFNFFCHIHPGMHGTVIVSAGD